MRQIATVEASARGLRRSGRIGPAGNKTQGSRRTSSRSRRGGRCEDRRHDIPARSLEYLCPVGITALRRACAARASMTVPAGAPMPTHVAHWRYYHGDPCRPSCSLVGDGKKMPTLSAVFFARSLVTSAAWNARALGPVILAALKGLSLVSNPADPRRHTDRCHKAVSNHATGACRVRGKQKQGESPGIERTSKDSTRANSSTCDFAGVTHGSQQAGTKQRESEQSQWWAPRVPWFREGGNVSGSGALQHGTFRDRRTSA